MHKCAFRTNSFSFNFEIDMQIQLKYENILFAVEKHGSCTDVLKRLFTRPDSERQNHEYFVKTNKLQMLEKVTSSKCKTTFL